MHFQGGRGRGAPGGRGRANSAGRGRGQKPRFNGRCQVCFKEGHSATNCWHRFDADYVPEEKNVNTVSHGYGTDSTWYTDTRATDHITSELDKLVIHDKYNGSDQIRTASGAGMNINRIGKAIVSTPRCNLHLNNVLHVPLKRILFRYIILLLIIMLSLNFILISFWLRIRPRRKLFWKASVEVVYILYLNQDMKLIVLSNRPRLDGIVD
jgi:hypothetical protein